MIEDSISGPAVDIWAIGCITFKMYMGITPFYDPNEYMIFNKIKNFEINPIDVYSK